MKQNGWIIWQVQPRFPGWRMLVSVLASLWQSFCHLQSSPSFTPISGPGPACSELSREKEQVFDKSYVEIVLFDNNNMSTVCPLSACLSLSPGASPDPRTKSHYCKSVDITTEQLIISPRSLFCLTDYCKVFRIAKCRQQCLIFKSRPGEEKSDPLEALQTILIPGRCSQVTKLKCEADAHSLNKLLISASSNAVFAGVGPWLSL